MFENFWSPFILYCLWSKVHSRCHLARRKPYVTERCIGCVCLCTVLVRNRKKSLSPDITGESCKVKRMYAPFATISLLHFLIIIIIILFYIDEKCMKSSCRNVCHYFSSTRSLKKIKERNTQIPVLSFSLTDSELLHLHPRWLVEGFSSAGNCQDPPESLSGLVTKYCWANKAHSKRLIW